TDPSGHGSCPAAAGLGDCADVGDIVQGIASLSLNELKSLSVSAGILAEESEPFIGGVAFCDSNLFTVKTDTGVSSLVGDLVHAYVESQGGSEAATKPTFLLGPAMAATMGAAMQMHEPIVAPVSGEASGAEATTTVGRWMPPAELRAMKEFGLVQE